jgi:hypothetical protein
MAAISVAQSAILVALHMFVTRRSRAAQGRLDPDDDCAQMTSSAPFVLG